MTIKLDDYHAQLDALDPRVRGTLEASFAEAARVMSPQGLHNWLEGAKGLSQLGRGNELVITYIQSMPAVVKQVGEDVLKDCIVGAMKLASMVSGEVIQLMFDTLPTAAHRLGDAELLRGYLGLIHQLSAKVPRGLRPMLSHLDELFGKLTLGGLRRWALWGAQAHLRDFPAQIAYFDLKSADSQAMLQKERRGTLFIDNQRKLNFYLRAFWGRDFFMRPTSGDYETREGYRPFIESRVIHLPDAFDDFAAQGSANAAGGPSRLPASQDTRTSLCVAESAGAAAGTTGKDLYRATAAHAAAHLVYTKKPLSMEQLNPAQMFVIGLFEDARVEALAIREFPGMKQMWSAFHAKVREVSCSTVPVVSLLERLAYALLDEGYHDDDGLIQEMSAMFRSEFAKRPGDNQSSWDLGVTLYNKLGERGGIPSLRVLESMAIPYRDDNRYCWASDEIAWHEAEYLPAPKQVRKYVTAMEMVNELDCELAGDDAQEIWVLDTPFYLDQEGVTINELEGKEPVSEPYHYQEWDYGVQLHRPNWVTVLEKRQQQGDPADIDRILAENKPVAARLRHIIDAMQPEGVQRFRRQEDGEEIDLNAAIRAMIDIRMGQTPDPRINIRIVRKVRDLAVLVLLDLSESTNEKLGGSEKPVIQLAREATALLSWAIDRVGDPFAIHGFASDSRHDVEYFRFKDFKDSYSDGVKAKLAGMQGGLSTRMGGALRHAASFLLKQPEQKKLILLVTDGEPADIDVRDPQYLRHDTKKAVEELATRGVRTFCLTLDPKADEYVARIFGAKGYMVVDHVNRLPERLPMLYAGLTR
ncbi:MAG: VWA domain-containing protein [Candidatus Muproteobacteria bacterium RBG_16_64_11]|uniref:VWA domain-containing protein n=1 Tax=Candidatus Muproteobacteria bacterium RBG_16_64_11 TaxID=1817758 RepID=A0A1F6THC3_9PROT|nr:MAG: VWA domain-containing protein [Candidatus Muproteobacteria bacterium RBG_16_64_11]